MPHVDLVKHVMELPHGLLSLFMRKALSPHMAEPALEGRNRAVPLQSSGMSDLAPPEHHMEFNQSGPWPPQL